MRGVRGCSGSIRIERVYWVFAGRNTRQEGSHLYISVGCER